MFEASSIGKRLSSTSTWCPINRNNAVTRGTTHKQVARNRPRQMIRQP